MSLLATALQALSLLAEGTCGHSGVELVGREATSEFYAARQPPRLAAATRTVRSRQPRGRSRVLRRSPATSAGCSRNDSPKPGTHGDESGIPDERHHLGISRRVDPGYRVPKASLVNPESTPLAPVAGRGTRGNQMSRRERHGRRGTRAAWPGDEGAVTRGQDAGQVPRVLLGRLPTWGVTTRLS